MMRGSRNRSGSLVAVQGSDPISLLRRRVYFRGMYFPPAPHAARCGQGFFVTKRTPVRDSLQRLVARGVSFVAGSGPFVFLVRSLAVLWSFFVRSLSVLCPLVVRSLSVLCPFVVRSLLPHAIFWDTPRLRAHLSLYEEEESDAREGSVYKSSFIPRLVGWACFITNHLYSLLCDTVCHIHLALIPNNTSLPFPSRSPFLRWGFGIRSDVRVFNGNFRSRAKACSELPKAIIPTMCTFIRIPLPLPQEPHSKGSVLGKRKTCAI